MLTAPVSAAEYLSELCGHDRVEELIFGHRRNLPRIVCPNGVVVLDRLAAILSEQVVAALPLLTLLRHPIDLVLDEHLDLVLHPPLALVLPERARNIKGPTQIWGAPSLVVELLSQSSARRLRHTKLHWYGGYGVDESWMIDMRHQRVEVASYSKRKLPLPNIYSSSTPIESPLLPNVSFCAADLFWDSVPLFNTVTPAYRSDRRHQ
jgi:hypothetical protein